MIAARHDVCRCDRAPRCLRLAATNCRGLSTACYNRLRKKSRVLLDAVAAPPKCLRGRTCSVPGCSGKHVARGVCEKHRSAVRRFRAAAAAEPAILAEIERARAVKAARGEVLARGGRFCASCEGPYDNYKPDGQTKGPHCRACDRRRYRGNSVCACGYVRGARIEQGGNGRVCPRCGAAAPVVGARGGAPS